MVVIVEVPGKDSTQVGFVEDDEVVQAFAANGTDESFAVRVLPGRLGGSGNFLDAQVLDTRWKYSS